MFETKSSWLFLDASGVKTRVGVWQDARWLAWRESEAPALESLFASTHSTLEEAKISWGKLGGYIYIEGPGSVLGLRLAAMAIRAWQVDTAAHSGGTTLPVLSCGSLQLAAALAIASGEKPSFTVFTDAKQGFWQIMEVHSSETEKFSAGLPQEIKEEDLPAGTLLHLPARKAWHRAPERARTLPVSLRDHPAVLALPSLLRRVETPTPYAGRPPEYKKWTGAK